MQIVIYLLQSKNFACKQTNAYTASQLIFETIIINFGTPAILNLDLATCFNSDYFKTFATQWNIQLNFVPADQHQWNGIAERMCGTIRSQLTKTVSNNWSNWDQYL